MADPITDAEINALISTDNKLLLRAIVSNLADALKTISVVGGTIKKDWTDSSQIIGTSDGYVTLSGTTESYSSDVDLETDGLDGVHLIVEINYDDTPTDEVTIKIYGSLDGTNYDDTPIYSIQGNKATDPQQLSFVIKDLNHFRIGVVQAGSTDSHDVRAYYKAYRYIST